MVTIGRPFFEGFRSVSNGVHRNFKGQVICWGNLSLEEF
jgi:hypothetical protein